MPGARDVDSAGWRLRASTAALSVAVALSLVLLRQLHASGGPLLGLRGPAIYLPAALAGLALAGWAALRGWSHAPVAAAGVALAVFLANDRLIASGDTHGAALLPYNVLRRGSLSLDGLAPSPPPYWIVERSGHSWSRYPIAGPLLALPVYLPVALGPGRPGSLPEAEKLAAALMCALSVGFVLSAAQRLGAARWLAGSIAALYAFGSPVLSTASQALWQHAPSVLALSAALWAASRAREHVSYDLIAGACCGFAVAARPTDALMGAGILAAVAARGWPPLLRATAAAAVPIALVLSYQAAAFGSPLATGYGGEIEAFTTPLGEGLDAVLLSPTRGLLTFVPWAALSALGLIIGARREVLLLGAGVGAAATTVLFARWHAWWGGWCYGPRLLADLSPVLALGLTPLAALPRRPVVACLAAAGLAGVALNCIGSFASRSSVARAVYDVRDAREAMEWWRWPPARLLRAVRPEEPQAPSARTLESPAASRSASFRSARSQVNSFSVRPKCP